MQHLCSCQGKVNATHLLLNARAVVALVSPEWLQFPHFFLQSLSAFLNWSIDLVLVALDFQHCSYASGHVLIADLMVVRRPVMLADYDSIRGLALGMYKHLVQVSGVLFRMLTKLCGVFH